VSRSGRPAGRETTPPRSTHPPRAEEGFLSPRHLPGPVEFVGSFPDPRVRLDPALPEVAFLGRSNVGKSSLLNAILGRKGVARVSATPGKTRAINVFRLPRLYLVDLPGYGYAKASKQERAAFRRLLDGYLSCSRSSGIVWLLDARHLPSVEDLAHREWLVQGELPTLVVLTKADKLGRMAQREQQHAIAAAIELPPEELLLTSSTTGQGISDLVESILAVANRETS